MSLDYLSLLKRYQGKRVCLSLHSQTSFWGTVAGISFDSVRLTDVQLVSEVDLPNLFHHEGHNSQGLRYRETLIHLNQIVAVTCLDEHLAEPPLDHPANAALERRAVVEAIEILVGNDLSPLFDEQRGDFWPAANDRLRAILATDLGLLIPRIAWREVAALGPRSYVITIRGVTAFRGQLEVDKLLAIEPAQPVKHLPGKRQAHTPLGLAGIWIRRGLREMAELYGYALHEPLAIFALQLEQVLRQRAGDLFGRQQLEDLLDQVRLVAPAAVEEVIPEIMPPRQLQKVLRFLLREGVPVRDMETILEAVAELGSTTPDLEQLSEQVRLALSALLTERYCDSRGVVSAITLDPALEIPLIKALRPGKRFGRLELTGAQGEALVAAIETHAAELRSQGKPEVLLAARAIRAALRTLIAKRLPRCVVLSPDEIEATATIEVAAVIFGGKAFDAEKPKRAIVDPPPAKSTTGAAPTNE